MSRLMRTFVACSLPRPFARRLHARAAALGARDPALVVPAVEHLHLTLAFLGDTRLEDVHRIAAVLREAARHVEPITIRSTGLGAFPDPARARIVHAPIEEVLPGGALVALHARLGVALEELGFPRERRRWQPHVTLARARGRPSPATVAAIEAGGPADGGAVATLSDLRLISSDPAERDYSYKDLTVIRFATGAESGAWHASDEDPDDA